MKQALTSQKIIFFNEPMYAAKSPLRLWTLGQLAGQVTSSDTSVLFSVFTSQHRPALHPILTESLALLGDSSRSQARSCIAQSAQKNHLDLTNLRYKKRKEPEQKKKTAVSMRVLCPPPIHVHEVPVNELCWVGLRAYLFSL